MLFAFHSHDDRIFSRFYTIHECDGQTPSQPATARRHRPRLCTVSSGNKNQYKLIYSAIHSNESSRDIVTDLQASFSQQPGLQTDRQTHSMTLYKTVPAGSNPEPVSHLFRKHLAHRIEYSSLPFVIVLIFRRHNHNHNNNHKVDQLTQRVTSGLQQ